MTQQLFKEGHGLTPPMNGHCRPHCFAADALCRNQKIHTFNVTHHRVGDQVQRLSTRLCAEHQKDQKNYSFSPQKAPAIMKSLRKIVSLFAPFGYKFRLSRQAAQLSFAPRGYKFRLSRQAAQLSFISANRSRPRQFFAPDPGWKY